jgi:hypothetical protein
MTLEGFPKVNRQHLVVDLRMDPGEVGAMPLDSNEFARLTGFMFGPPSITILPDEHPILPPSCSKVEGAGWSLPHENVANERQRIG